MAQPYNYMLDIPNPVESVNQSIANGFNLAAKVDQAQQQREQLALQKQEQARYQKDMGNLIENQTDENFTKTQLLHPAQAEAIQKVWDRKNQAEKDQAWSIGSQALMAVSNGQPLIAKQFFDDAALGFENANKKQDAGAMRFLSSMIEKNPDNAGKFLQGYLSTVDRDKFDKTFSTFREQDRADEMQPYAIKKSESETANNYSQISDRKEGRELQKTEMYLNDDRYYAGLDQNERQFWAKMGAEERKAAREMAEKPETTTERLTRLEKAEGYNAAATQAREAAENASRLAKLADENGGAYWDRLMSNVPGTSENAYRKDVETLKSQVFLNQIEQMRGLGALTEAEGAALKTSIASLDMNQGVDSFKKNLSKVSLVLGRAAKKAEKNAERYSTKGRGYSSDVVEAAKKRGISNAEMQNIANEIGW